MRGNLPQYIYAAHRVPPTTCSAPYFSGIYDPKKCFGHRRVGYQGFLAHIFTWESRGYQQLTAAPIQSIQSRTRWQYRFSC